MTAISDLGTLLAGLAPNLKKGCFVFVSLPDGRYGDGAELAPVGSFQEEEGLTLIVPQSRADAAGLAYTAVFRAITLQVHSSLSAVGLTAAVAAALAARGISANVVAARYHDHIFVPADHADTAFALLQRLQRQADAQR